MDSCNVCSSWKDGSFSWHPMSEVKNYYPIQSAEYTLLKKELQDQPAFHWWVEHTIRQSKIFIASITTKICKEDSQD